jgi:hypothetical protein
MRRFESFLRRHVPFKEIGWTDLGEEFTRYQLLKTPWFNLYLHQLWAPNWHPECHDHPWGFVAILLKKGYLERSGGKDVRRRPGAILFRPATFAHNVITPYGTSWSLIFTTRKSRDWGFLPCTRWIHRPTLSWQEYRNLYEKS